MGNQPGKGGDPYYFQEPKHHPVYHEAETNKDEDEEPEEEEETEEEGNDNYDNASKYILFHYICLAYQFVVKEYF
jgi:hypothetical protein